MKHRNLGCLLVGLVLPCASGQAANLIQDPDFDSGLTAWTSYIGFGTFQIANADGSPSAPAAQLSTVPFSVGSELEFTQCVSLVGSSAPWDFGMRTRIVSTTGSSCQIDVSSIFITSSCSLPETVVTFGVGASPSGTVTGVQGTFTQYAATTPDPMPGGNPSLAAVLRVFVYCPITGDSMTLNVDHAYLGTSGTTPVRLQSFDVM